MGNNKRKKGLDLRSAIKSRHQQEEEIRRGIEVFKQDRKNVIG